MDILGADNDQHKHAYYSPGYAVTKPYNNLSIRRVYIVTGRHDTQKALPSQSVRLLFSSIVILRNYQLNFLTNLI